MKKILLSWLIATIYLTAVNAQYETQRTGFEGDYFSLQGALDLFKSSDSLTEFERRLNTADTYVNNLDLNSDGHVDYIRVEHRRSNDYHVIVLQALIGRDEVQDVAVIELEKTGNSRAVLQIVGDEDVFGETVIVEPRDDEYVHYPYTDYSYNTTYEDRYVNVFWWSLVASIFNHSHHVYVSPYRWNYYPMSWRSWRQCGWNDYYPRVAVYHSHFHIASVHRVVRVHNWYRPSRSYCSRVVGRSSWVRNNRNHRHRGHYGHGGHSGHRGQKGHYGNHNNGRGDRGHNDRGDRGRNSRGIADNDRDRRRRTDKDDGPGIRGNSTTSRSYTDRKTKDQDQGRKYASPKVLNQDPQRSVRPSSSQPSRPTISRRDTYDKPGSNIPATKDKRPATTNRYVSSTSRGGYASSSSPSSAKGVTSRKVSSPSYPNTSYPSTSKIGSDTRRERSSSSSSSTQRDRSPSSSRSSRAVSSSKSSRGSSFEKPRSSSSNSSRSYSKSPERSSSSRSKTTSRQSSPSSKMSSSSKSRSSGQKSYSNKKSQSSSRSKSSGSKRSGKR